MNKLVLFIVMIVSLFSGCNSGNDKFIKKQVEKQIENREVFNSHYNEVSKFVFEKYPNAKTILYGDLYIIDGEPKKVKMFLRPTIFDFKSEGDFIKNSGTDKINEDNSFEKLYVLNADLENEQLKNISIAKFKNTDLHDTKWELHIWNIIIKLLSYISPPFIDFINVGPAVIDHLGLISTTIIPSKVVNKEFSSNINSSMNNILDKYKEMNCDNIENSKNETEQQFGERMNACLIIATLISAHQKLSDYK